LLNSRVVAAIPALTISAVRTPLRGTSPAAPQSTPVAALGPAAIGLSDLVFIAAVSSRRLRPSADAPVAL